MSVSLYSVKYARTVLMIQLVTIVIIGALFALKDVIWGLSALAGGAAAWLPNVLFLFLAWRLQGQTPDVLLRSRDFSCSHDASYPLLLITAGASICTTSTDNQVIPTGQKTAPNRPNATTALAGGAAAWLPNVLFLFLAWRLQGQTPASGRVAWSFALGEIAKVFATIIFR